MSVYITGDTHGFYNDLVDRIKYRCKEEDTLIITGDFGFIFEVNPVLISHENSLLESLDELGITILFIDGNHENFTRLNKLDREELFGGVVGVVKDNIYHLRRGYVFTIEDKTIFTMGGGVSVNRESLSLNIDWWSEEEPNQEELNRGIDNLAKVGNKVDYIITHCAPIQAEGFIVAGMKKSGQYNKFKHLTLYAETKYHSHIHNIVEFKEWHFGHYHFDGVNSNNKLHCHYTKVVDFIREGS